MKTVDLDKAKLLGSAHSHLAHVVNEAAKQLRLAGASSHAELLILAMNETTRSRHSSLRIRDNAATIFAGMIASPAAQDSHWNRNEAATDAVYSALAIEAAAEGVSFVRPETPAQDATSRSSDAIASSGY